MYQVTLCVRVTRIVLCVASCAHTRKCTRVDGWVASKGVFSSENTFVIYWSFIIIVHIVVYLQSIETDRCFLWLVSIFYLHQFLPATLQTSDIVQTNLQMHEVSDTYRPMLKCSFILCIILYCTIYIYIYIHIYIYVAYLYSNYCCIFGILTAFSPGTKLVWMLLSGRQSISMDSFGSYSNCRSAIVMGFINQLITGGHHPVVIVLFFENLATPKIPSALPQNPIRAMGDPWGPLASGAT